MVVILSFGWNKFMSHALVDGPSERLGAFRPRLGSMAEEQNTDSTAEIEGQDHGVHLPPDPAIRKLAKRGRGEFMSVVKEHPSSTLCWALLAEGSLLCGTDAADVAAYAYARTGRDLGLEQLRDAGWDGEGAVDWGYLPNQGVFRCLHALAMAAERLGFGDESDDADTLLRELSDEAWRALRGDEVPADGAVDVEVGEDESDGDQENDHQE